MTNHTEKKCCEDCHVEYCYEEKCPCHATPTEQKCPNNCDENHICVKCSIQKLSIFDTSSTLDEWRINWKAVLSEKLFDAQAAPATIVRIVETAENLFNHLLSKRDAEIREMIEGLTKQPILGELKWEDLSDNGKITRSNKIGYNQALSDILAKLDNQ